jgi:tryptophan-rich hypothetical protein
MNRVNPKGLLHSKWTKVDVRNKEKHFVITSVEFDDQQTVVECVIEAVMTRNEYLLNWRELQDPACWKVGWC